MSNSDDSEEFHRFIEETELEAFETPIDADEGGLNVFLLFKSVFDGLCLVLVFFEFLAKLFFNSKIGCSL